MLYARQCKGRKHKYMYIAAMFLAAVKLFLFEELKVNPNDIAKKRVDILEN